jgi:hypothetical protein
MANASELGCQTFFLNLKGHHLGFHTELLPSLERKLFVMCERIGKAQKMAYSADQFVTHGITANRSGFR